MSGNLGVSAHHSYLSGPEGMAEWSKALDRFEWSALAFFSFFPSIWYQACIHILVDTEPPGADPMGL